MNTAKIKYLCAKKELRRHIINEDNDVKIRDPNLRECILEQTKAEDKQHYLQQTVEVYQSQLRDSNNQNSQAAIRLPPLIFKLKGPQAFVKVLLNSCVIKLIDHRLYTYAISFCKQALQMVSPGSRQEADIKYFLGRSYHVSETDENLFFAEEMYCQALKIYKSSNHLEKISLIYSHLGDIYTNQNKLIEAKEMQLKALEIYEQTGKNTMTPYYYGRLAMVYLRQRKFDEAEEMAHKSLKLAEQLDLKEEMSRQYGNLGLIYLQQYRFQDAERTLKKGLDLDRRLDRLIGMACKCFNLGWVYKARQDFKNAKEYWQTSKLLFEKFGITHMVHKIEELLADIDEYNQE